MHLNLLPFVYGNVMVNNDKNKNDFGKKKYYI